MPVATEDQALDKAHARLLAACKTYVPHKLRAFCGSDDDGRDVAIAGPSNRRKWSRVIATVGTLPWSRIELLDKSGALLSCVDNDAAATEVEDLATGKSAAEYSAMSRMMELCSKVVFAAQEKVLAYRDKETKTILERQADTIKEMSAAMHAVSAMYREQVEVVRESAAEEAEAAAMVQAAKSEGVDWKELMQALPMLVQALPALRAMLTGQAGVPPVSNGHNH